MPTLPAYLTQLDAAVFTVQASLSEGDKQSFLRVQRLAAERLGEYEYLEIGSDLGGSLVPYLLDPSCRSAVSIDLRPTSQPDERGKLFYYPENTTERMKQTVAASIGDEKLRKLTTFDSDASAVQLSMLPARVDVAMIDGEHTDTACFADFCQVMGFVKDDAIICFHDANLVADAIQNAERMLTFLGLPFTTVFLPDCVCAIGIRGMAAGVAEDLAPAAKDRVAYLRESREGRLVAVANSMAEAGKLPDLETARSEAAVAIAAADVSVKLAEQLQKQLQVQTQALHSSGALMADLEQRHAAATVKAEALQASTSWRVTAPLRALRRTFK